MQVPFISLDRQYRALRTELMAAFDRVGNSGVYIMGPELERFEKEAAAYCGTKYAVGVASGADALFLSLKATGIGPGDEVITCPNSFIATAGIIAATGATPTFVDSGADFNIDVEKLEPAIGDRTRAIIPVHLTGRPADMDPINAIAERHGLYVFEDAAQAIGARYKGRRVGSLGTTAGFSLHPLKNLGVLGDGGLVTTNDRNLYEAIVKLRNHGLRNRDECELWGYNSRLDPLQAAIASIKLTHLEDWNKRCRDIAARYRDGLADLVVVPTDRDYEEPVYHNFIIQLERRDDLIAHLEACGVGSRVHYPIPIHLQHSARGLRNNRSSFTVTEEQARRILSLPIYPELADAEVDYVINSVRRFFEK